jgi:ergothioneine biosynthesis protein EgtB
MKTAMTPEHALPGLRQADPAALAAALANVRMALLQLFAAYRAALGDELRFEHSLELNLPLWELGHIGWFEEHWLARNPCRNQGTAADVEGSTWGPSRLTGADGLYNSSRVAHATRWQLPLPDVAQTLDYLASVRDDSLALLRAADETDDALYFFRLSFFHEAMHREAWVYMAQTLGIPLVLDGPEQMSQANGEISLSGGGWQTGYADAGFAFDNELGAHELELQPFAIDRSVVSWRRYLPFVEAAGYDDARCWSEAGWAWRQRHGQAQPRYLRRTDDGWQRQRFGQWQALDERLPAMHLTAYEAEAWCRWAGRRLPGEAEWEMAACSLGSDAFTWGDVWEWTASPFAPYPGFAAHPYRDYSAPWFDGRPVLRGASFATDAHLRHPRYRNFFTAERNDIFAGFRSCAA